MKNIKYVRGDIIDYSRLSNNILTNQEYHTIQVPETKDDIIKIEIFKKQSIENSFITNIIIFEDGEYFNGVKGKQIRKTNNFKDAKIMNEISDRDKRYLDSQSKSYKLIKVKYTLDIME